MWRRGRRGWGAGRGRVGGGCAGIEGVQVDEICGDVGSGGGEGRRCGVGNGGAYSTAELRRRYGHEGVGGETRGVLIVGCVLRGWRGLGRGGGRGGCEGGEGFGEGRRVLFSVVGGGVGR